MTQVIIVGVLGLLLGFGAGQWTQDNTMELNQNRMSNTGQQMQQRSDTPLADDFVSARPEINAMAIEDLSQAEIDGMLLMREEEKLARDVYTVLYEQWGMQIFANIAQSEQTHTEAMRQLLEKYNIADPVVDDAVGVFVDQNMQVLYDQLVAKGSESLVAALQVGATVEELDIKDLSDLLEETDNADITMVYESLQRGSRNHLRSFAAQLAVQGGSYMPQYISAAEYEAIIATDRETGAGAGRGWGNGVSGG